MATPRERERATLMDRVALAFLSGVSTFLLAGLMWFGVRLAAAQFAFGWTPSFSWVLAASALMAVLGFVLLENVVAAGIGALLRWVLNLFRAVAP